MKKIKSIFVGLLSLVLLVAMVLPVSAALSTLSSDIKLYTISRADLVARAERVVKSGEITYTPFYNISYLTKGDLQQAAEVSRKKGGKVFFYFDTLIKDHINSRIVVNPFLVNGGDGDLSFIVDASAETNKAVTDKFTKTFGRKVAVMKCSQENFGFTVVLASKLDLTGMDTSKLVAYTYNAATNKYAKIAEANCTVDQQGFMYLETSKGGYIIVTEAQ